MFANNLKAYRKRLGHQRSAVAQAIGIKKSKLLSRWEKGTAFPDPVSFFKLCILYRATPFELYRDFAQKIVDSMPVHYPSAPLPTIEY